MAMILHLQARDSLIRLWKSMNSANHDLAFEMIKGLNLQNEDLLWLWDTYQSWESKPYRKTTLTNFPNMSQDDILKGRILSIILESNIGESIIRQYFFNHQSLRLPYNTLEHIPSCLTILSPEVQQWVWQDGELLEIGENIIHFQGLRHIDFRRQPIQYIHPNVALLPHLEEIYLVSTSFLPPELSERHDIEIYTVAPY